MFQTATISSSWKSVLLDYLRGLFPEIKFTKVILLENIKSTNAFRAASGWGFEGHNYILTMWPQSKPAPTVTHAGQNATSFCSCALTSHSLEPKRAQRPISAHSFLQEKSLRGKHESVETSARHPWSQWWSGLFAFSIWVSVLIHSNTPIWISLVCASHYKSEQSLKRPRPRVSVRNPSNLESMALLLPNFFFN